MTLTPVPDGWIGTVVTHLEMSAPPHVEIPPSPLALAPWPTPDPDAYRALFRAVGGSWLWYSRLLMSDEALAAATHRAETQVHVALESGSGEPVGLLELTHPEPDWCALDFLGLVPVWIGRGQGRWLLANALALAWRAGVTFIRVNTCTLDHPAALPNYLRAGFRVTGRSVETFPDPRLSGVLPPGIAPHAPVASPARGTVAAGTSPAS